MKDTHVLICIINIIAHADKSQWMCFSIVRSLWSDIHFADWYENIYFNNLLQRGDTSAKWLELNEWSDNTLEESRLTESIAIILQRGRLIKNILFGKKCTAWYGREKEDAPSSRGILACPCTRRQASVDTRFDDDESCNNGNSGCDRFPGAYNCIRSVAAR